MATRQTTRTSSRADIIDRVLDKGIVIDAMAGVGLLGIDNIVEIDARVVVASIETYLLYVKPLSHAGLAARPAPRLRRNAKRRPVTSTSVKSPIDPKVTKFSSEDLIRAHGLGIRLGDRFRGDGRTG